MVQSRFFALVPLLFGLLFCVLFYHQGIGVNVVLFELPLFALVICTKKLKSLSFTGILAGAMVLCSLLLVMIQHTDLVIFFHFCSLIIFAGALAFPTQNALNFTFFIALQNGLLCLHTFFQHWKQLLATYKLSKWTMRFFKRAILPLVAVWLFALMYRSASPWFDDLAGRALDLIGDAIEAFMEQMDPVRLMLFVAGFVLAVMLLYATCSDFLKARSQQASDYFMRVRNTRFHGRMNALSNEYKLGVMLFFSLNLLLLLVNVLDVYWVWFNFEWEGQFLKQFVHEGTYLLIFSIVLSVVLVLYFFRGNQQLFQKVWLKRLAQFWMVQNGLLAVSVGVRNWWYVQHFALAFKRIGVFIFLIFVLVFLVSVVFKIRRNMSFQYLWRVNFLSGFLLFFAMSIPNWNVVIAQYNFAHADTAFVELDFMATLDVAALPCLMKSDAQLATFAKQQAALFHFKKNYMSEYEYALLVTQKHEAFLASYSSKHWLSWNWADNQLFKKLNMK